MVIVSHALAVESNRRRWELLEEEYPVEVSLIVPDRWVSEWFDERQAKEIQPIDNGGFRVIPLPVTDYENWGKYLFKSLDTEFRSIQPDVIYLIQDELSLVNQQVILYRNLWAPDAKIIFFSMNALGVNQDSWHHRFRWNRLRKNSEAALCHYPGCRNSLQDAGFDGPIYLQTQVGVNDRLFDVDEAGRRKTRGELGIAGSFVVGFVGRLVEDKGVDDLLEAFPLTDVDWSLLLVGDGDLRADLEEKVKREGWEDRVQFTGYVPQDDVPRYMRAMDALVLPSKTMPHWIDTFPLVPVQAMACGVPVVVSDSGALPFQVGDEGLVFPESDVPTLNEHLTRLASDKELRDRLSVAGRERSMEYFTTDVLADNFYEILRQVEDETFRRNQDRNPYDQIRAYYD